MVLEDRSTRDLQREMPKIVAERMKDRLTTPNGLAQRVKTDPDLSRRARSEFVKMDASSVLFPRLDFDYLRTITCGTYQISLTPGYIAEHLSDDGDYEVWFTSTPQTFSDVKYILDTKAKRNITFGYGSPFHPMLRPQ